MKSPPLFLQIPTYQRVRNPRHGQDNVEHISAPVSRIAPRQIRRAQPEHAEDEDRHAEPCDKRRQKNRWEASSRPRHGSSRSVWISVRASRIRNARRIESVESHSTGEGVFCRISGQIALLIFNFFARRDDFRPRRVLMWRRLPCGAGFQPAAAFRRLSGEMLRSAHFLDTAPAAFASLGPPVLRVQSFRSGEQFDWNKAGALRHQPANSARAGWASSTPATRMAASSTAPSR